MAAMQPGRAAISTTTGHRSHHVRVLELYSGSGGMHYSLMKACPNLRKNVTALDVNENANAVYLHNFAIKARTASIEHLTVQDIDRIDAQLWLMSPPCQPFTTTNNSKQRDADDPRSKSFLHLLNLLQILSCKPTCLLLENVAGFLGSRVHARFQSVLQQADYSLEEYLLSPQDLGVPNSRPRYFALAMQHTAIQQAQQAAAQTPARLTKQQRAILRRARVNAPPPGMSPAPTSPHEQAEAQAEPDLPPAACRPLQDYLEPLSDLHSTDPVLSTTVAAVLHSSQNSQHHDSSHLLIPAAKLQRYHKILDLATPASTTSSCFTKNYMRNILGAGSLLASEAFARSYCQQDTRGRWYLAECSEATLQAASKAGALRFFTPSEIANLHGLPKEGFGFPKGLGLRAQYQLLGNGLSVDCVALLLQHMVEVVGWEGA